MHAQRPSIVAQIATFFSDHAWCVNYIGKQTTVLPNRCRFTANFEAADVSGYFHLVHVNSLFFKYHHFTTESQQSVYTALGCGWFHFDVTVVALWLPGRSTYYGDMMTLACFSDATLR